MQLDSWRHRCLLPCFLLSLPSLFSFFYTRSLYVALSVLELSVCNLVYLLGPLRYFLFGKYFGDARDYFYITSFFFGAGMNQVLALARQALHH